MEEKLSASFWGQDLSAVARRRDAQFHLHPEDKFLNGDFLDRGRTERRHVVATDIRLIGKEANRWEEEELAGEIEDVAEFGVVEIIRSTRD